MALTNNKTGDFYFIRIKLRVDKEEPGQQGGGRALSSTAAEVRPKSTLSARLNVSTPSMHS